MTNHTNVASKAYHCSSLDQGGEHMFTVGKVYVAETHKGEEAIVDDNGRHRYPDSVETVKLGVRDTDGLMMRAFFDRVEVANGVDWGLQATPVELRIDPTKHTYRTRSGKRVENVKVEMFSGGHEMTGCVKGSIVYSEKPLRMGYQIWMLDGRTDMGGRHEPLDLVCDDQPLDRDWTHGWRGEVTRTDGGRFPNGDRYLMSAPFRTEDQAVAWTWAFTCDGSHRVCSVRKCRCLRDIVMDVEYLGPGNSKNLSE